MLEQIITFRIDSQLMIVSKYLGKDAKPDNFLLKRSQQIFIKSKYSGAKPIWTKLNHLV
jgi:hypothetical protein